jgi:predicted GTPase
MTTTLENITKQAIHLSPHQRIALASFLLKLDSTGAGEDAVVEQVWEDEIEARIRAVDSGSAVGISYSEVMREADSRFVP